MSAHLCLKYMRAQGSACAQEASLQLLIVYFQKSEQQRKKQKRRRQHQRSLLTCVTASPSLGFQLFQSRQRQVYNSSVKVAAVEARGEETKQNKICLPGEEGKCAAPCQDHRGEDARSNPAGAPQSLLLHVAHILQRPERTFNHMAKTHAQNEENKRGRGWHRGREGQAQRKAEKVGE